MLDSARRAEYFSKHLPPVSNSLPRTSNRLKRIFDSIAAAFLLIQQLQKPSAQAAHYRFKQLWRFLNQASLLSLVMAGALLSYAQPMWVHWKADELPEPAELRSHVSEIDLGEAADFSLRVQRLLEHSSDD